jgi:DNA-binding NarL/FixJ family response regulator
MSESWRDVPISYKRILLIEDDSLTAIQITRAFEALGVEIIGPAGSLGKAIELAESEEFDCALVDINLRGVDAYPAVDILMRRNSPVAFVTVYDKATIPENYRKIPLIQKPVDASEIAKALAA